MGTNSDILEVEAEIDDPVCESPKEYCADDGHNAYRLCFFGKIFMLHRPVDKSKQRNQEGYQAKTEVDFVVWVFERLFAD